MKPGSEGSTNSWRRGRTGFSKNDSMSRFFETLVHSVGKAPAARTKSVVGNCTKIAGTAIR